VNLVQTINALRKTLAYPTSIFHGLQISPSPKALPDDGFVRQISKILADLKVVWRAKNISGGYQFLADFWRI
jgi:hypothetical protein